MKKGERTPEPVRDFILEQAGRHPRPTNQEIRQAIHGRWGLDVSLRQIHRLCQKAGLPTGSVRRGSVDPRAHQEFLRDKADSLSFAVEEFTRPFPSVWGVSFRPGDPGSGMRLRTKGKNIGVEWDLNVERESGWKFFAQHRRSDSSPFRPKAYPIAVVASVRRLF